MAQRPYQGKGNGQGKTRTKTRNRDSINSTASSMEKKRDCLDAKETQERIKSRSNPQPPPQQLAREVNHTLALPQQQQYCPIYSGLSSTQIHPSTLASAYYPNFLPAWQPNTLPQAQTNNHRAEASLTYINPRPPHITYIETSQPQ
jgi:hypothetical protein